MHRNARDGVDLDRSTLADWVGQSSALLAPLVAALGAHVLAGDKLHSDDTPVPVFLDLDIARQKRCLLFDHEALQALYIGRQ